MAEDIKNRYSDAELEMFRELIQEKIEKATEQLHLIESAYRNDSNNGYRRHLAYLQGIR